MEYLTKWCESKAVLDVTADTIAKFLIQEVIVRHGCPQSIVSDQGTNFCSEVMRVVARCLGVDQKFLFPNKILKQMLKIYVDTLRHDWDTFLPYILHAYRCAVQSST